MGLSARVPKKKMAIKDLRKFSKGLAQWGVRGSSKGDPKVWGLLLTPLLLSVVIQVPRWQAGRVALKDSEQYFEAENKARSTLLQGIGGAFFFVTAYVGLKQLKVAEDSRKLTEDKNVTDRFVKAAEMLADKDRLAVRLAGIYALERIARDSPEDHWTVMQLLISFIEDRAKESGKPEFLAKDLTVALSVIGKRNIKNDLKLVIGTEHQSIARLLFSFAHLRLAMLASLNFDRASFAYIDLSRSQLSQISFKDASFGFCPISKTQFTEGALSGAVLKECNLSGSKFVGTKVNRVRFLKCDLKASVFTDVDLSETVFDGSDLSGADFSSAKGLTEPEQVVQARNWKQAFYSPEFASKLLLTDEEREEIALIRLIKQEDLA